MKEVWEHTYEGDEGKSKTTRKRAKSNHNRVVQKKKPYDADWINWCIIEDHINLYKCWSPPILQAAINTPQWTVIHNPIAAM